MKLPLTWKKLDPASRGRRAWDKSQHDHRRPKATGASRGNRGAESGRHVERLLLDQRSGSELSAGAGCARPCFTPRRYSPWHAEQAKPRGSCRPFTEAGLYGRIPVMTKTDVMTNWDAIVTNRRLTLAGCNAHIAAKLNGTCKDYYYLDKYLVIAARGSSGPVRGVFPWGWNEFIEIICATFHCKMHNEPPGKLTGRRLLAVDRGRQDGSWQPLRLLHSHRSGRAIQVVPGIDADSQAYLRAPTMPSRPRSIPSPHRSRKLPRRPWQVD